MFTLIIAQSSLQIASPIGAVGWAVLAGIPVAIIALYFLKLRRRPVQVPSTLLWKRSLEDLHVNSLFQRLRRNLLLFLQLLAVALVLLALLGIRMKGTTSIGQRYVLTIDESASMGATDVAPTRLDRAKAEARKILDQMGGDDLAMIIAFSDKARVVSNYTANKQLLRARLNSIQPIQATTSLREALEVAAGLANPSSDLFARNLPEGVVAVNTTIPPKLYLFTDGGFSDIEGFSLGNLIPEVVVIGPRPPAPAEAKPGQSTSKTQAPSDNLAILALQTARNDERPDEFQVFGRIHNYRDEPVDTEAKLFRHDLDNPQSAPILIDAVSLKLPASSDQAFKFDLKDAGAAALEVQLAYKDALALDNRAFTVFGSPRKAKVLLVTAGNRYLTDTLKTPTAQLLADVTDISPEELKSDAVQRDLATGAYDLVIFDRIRPQASPEANTLYFGALPPGKEYERSREVENPQILDTNVAHPLTQYIRDLSTILISKALVVEPPPGSTILFEGNGGGQSAALGFVAPRSGFTDVVIAFGLLDGKSFNSNWQLKFSFPLFLFNCLRVLGNTRDAGGADSHQPNAPVVLRADSVTSSVRVTAPTGKAEDVKRSTQGTFVYNSAATTGLYQVRWGKDEIVPFAVNLFDPRESDLSTRGLAPEGASPTDAEKYQIKIGHTEVKGSVNAAPAFKAWWWYLAIAALGVVLLEWYIYNRRVYV